MSAPNSYQPPPPSFAVCKLNTASYSTHIINDSFLFSSGAGNFPSEYWLRESVVPKIKSDEEEEWIEKIAGHDIIVHCDESTDRRGRAIFIVLFRILPKNSSSKPILMVAGVSELTAPNAQQCCQSIIQVIIRSCVHFLLLFFL